MKNRRENENLQLDSTLYIDSIISGGAAMLKPPSIKIILLIGFGAFHQRLWLLTDFNWIE